MRKFIVGFSMILVSCGSPKPAQQQAISQQNADKHLAEVVLNGDIVRFGDLAKVKGITNLPQGTQLWFGLARSGSDRYSAEGFITVGSGSFESDPISNKGNSFKKGRYTLTIQTPLYDVQPDEVKPILGNQYANFPGKLRVNGRFGSKVISLEKTTKIDWDANSPWIAPSQ